MNGLGLNDIIEMTSMNGQRVERGIVVTWRYMAKYGETKFKVEIIDGVRKGKVLWVLDGGQIYNSKEEVSINVIKRG